MRIASVEEGSPAAQAGLRRGDRILAVNGHAVHDRIDFAFHAAEASLRIAVERGGRTLAVRVRRGAAGELGLQLSADPVRRCGNHCVFCFIDQNPKGLRPSLYVKDEDYRLSLLHGNYVTLTNLREGELARIIAQHLSPLYVSVHATDPEARRHLLGCRGRAEILPVLRDLTRGGIRLHAQIVLVPDHNDGAVLDRTLDDLEALAPGLRSVAVVPVGLTRHRAGLAALRRVRASEARALIARVHSRQEACRRNLGTRFHFLADEFYLLAGVPLPATGAYEDFAQVENGVGQVRRFDVRLRRARRLLPLRPAPCRPAPCRPAPRRARRARALLVTGTLFAPLLPGRMAAAMRRTGDDRCWDLAVRPAVNRFFGARVTVAGLLAGRDLLRAIRGAPAADLVLLPPEAFNPDGLTLDGWTAEDIARRSGAAVQVGFGSGSRPRDSRREGRESCASRS